MVNVEVAPSGSESNVVWLLRPSPSKVNELAIDPAKLDVGVEHDGIAEPTFCKVYVTIVLGAESK
jgi:hypothetical protein